MGGPGGPAARRREEALTAAGGAVRLSRVLAATRPARYPSRLTLSLTRQAILLIPPHRSAAALAAATEAADTCLNAIPDGQLDYTAAQALLIEGQLLHDQSRPREAPQPLARGITGSRDYQDLLGYAQPALRPLTKLTRPPSSAHGTPKPTANPRTG